MTGGKVLSPDKRPRFHLRRIYQFCPRLDHTDSHTHCWPQCSPATRDNQHLAEVKQHWCHQRPHTNVHQWDGWEWCVVVACLMVEYCCVIVKSLVAVAENISRLSGVVVNDRMLISCLPQSWQLWHCLGNCWCCCTPAFPSLISHSALHSTCDQYQLVSSC